MSVDPQSQDTPSKNFTSPPTKRGSFHATSSHPGLFLRTLMMVHLYDDVIGNGSNFAASIRSTMLQMYCCHSHVVGRVLLSSVSIDFFKNIFRFCRSVSNQ